MGQSFWYVVDIFLKWPINKSSVHMDFLHWRFRPNSTVVMLFCVQQVNARHGVFTITACSHAFIQHMSFIHMLHTKWWCLVSATKNPCVYYSKAFSTYYKDKQTHLGNFDPEVRWVLLDAFNLNNLKISASTLIWCVLIISQLYIFI